MARETREETRPGQEPSPEESKKKARRQRVPLGKHRSRLAVDPALIPPGKVARWINEHPAGRLQQAEAGGYAFVEHPNAEIGEGPGGRRDRLSTKMRCIVGTKPDNSPMYAYLMVIDKQLYDEDQREKQDQVDEIDDAIKRGGIATEDQDDARHRYIPDHGRGIKYEP